jgi:hypothetical protein
VGCIVQSLTTGACYCAFEKRLQTIPLLDPGMPAVTEEQRTLAKKRAELTGVLERLAAGDVPPGIGRASSGSSSSCYCARSQSWKANHDVAARMNFRPLPLLVCGLSGRVCHADGGCRARKSRNSHSERSVPAPRL